MNTTPTSGAADRAIESCPELNMVNYDEVDVERLNDWAIRANDEIDRLHALAAGQATAAQAVVPAGWKLVPEQPTLSMLIKGSDTDTSTSAEDCRRVYRAMLAAAPARPAAQQGVAYAALPESFLEIPDVQDESGINAYYSREVVLECIDAALASHGQAPAAAAPAADSVPATQGEMNVQLDIDSNHSAPGQQRDVARSVALGQPMGNGQDQAAGRPSAQGDKLLTVAERNIRSFLRSATFKSESDREAALNCVDVLWEAARAPAESVTAPAGPSRFADVIAVQRSEAEADTSDAYMVGLYNGMSMMDANYRNITDLEPMLTAPRPCPAKAADSVQEDAACWHWLAEYLVGTRTDLDDEIVASETVNDLRNLVKAAIKQGATP